MNSPSMPLRDRTKSIGITRFLCRIVDTVVGEHPFHTSVKKGRVCDGSGPGEARLAWAGWSLYQAGRSRLTVRRGRSLVGDFLPLSCPLRMIQAQIAASG